MGFGASVAGGCSIGNGLVETATMTWQRWIALASMIVMMYQIKVRRRNNYDHELGTVGMVCPFPLIEAQKKMATLQSGDELKLILIARKRRKLFQIGQQKMDIL